MGVVLAATTILGGCGGGASAPGVGIQNVDQSAPRLEERDPQGNYDPYYTTSDLQRPRYLHEALFVESGVVIAFSGSDERGLTALDNVEFYDQSQINKDAVRPETQTGIWFDTNFEGDPMVFETGPRLWFTVDELADGRIICIGGSANILAGPPRARAEVFDPTGRTFETINEEMVEPRFRHTTTVRNDGTLLVIGGQSLTTITIIEELFFANVQTTVTVFPSIPSVEVYSPTENLFLPFTLPNSNREVQLSTPRGRAGHNIGRIAGPDLNLGSANDVFLVVGGYQTLSPQFAPTTKLPGRVGALQADALKSLEFFDSQSNVFVQVSNVALDNGRVDEPFAMNLGQFNDFTPDGIPGVSNVLLITHGNTDSGCPDTISNLYNKVLAASFTGFGPAQGLQFFHVQDLDNNAHVQGSEYWTDLAPVPTPPGPLDPMMLLWIERALTNPVALPRRLATVEGVDDIATWIIALSGAHIFPAGVCVYDHASPVMDAGTIFDPFYSLRALQIGVSPRDLLSGRTNNNPTGIVGTWLVVDGDIPTNSEAGLGTTLNTARWARRSARARVYPVNLAIPGEDGIINTPDDRILMAGGGSNGATFGDEPTSPTCEVFLPPGVNSRVPSP